MKLYVGTYALYNAGSLKGAWLDTEDYSDFDEFAEACRNLHKDEEDPEFMVQDSEGEAWEEKLYHESGIAWVENWYEVSDELCRSSIDDDVFSAYVEATGCNVDADAVGEAEEAYRGHFYDGLEGYAEQAIEEGLFGDIPERIRYYISTEAIARDLKCEGYVEHDGYVFWPD